MRFFIFHIFRFLISIHDIFVGRITEHPTTPNRQLLFSTALVYLHNKSLSPLKPGFSVSDEVVHTHNKNYPFNVSSSNTQHM